MKHYEQKNKNEDAHTHCYNKKKKTIRFMTYNFFSTTRNNKKTNNIFYTHYFRFSCMKQDAERSEELQ